MFSPRTDSEAVKNCLGNKGKKLVLGVASSWSESKGLHGFIELSRLLGEEYYVALVGTMGQDVALPHNIRHIPATNSVQELAQYYSAADVFVTLSLEETFGKVSAEALACGTPVVCYNSTANGELVGEGCGRVIRSKMVTDVAKAVKEICSDEKKVYSLRCREFAQMNFSKEDRIWDYLAFYERLLSVQK